jgi:hypothetical protein
MNFNRTSNFNYKHRYIPNFNRHNQNQNQNYQNQNQNYQNQNQNYQNQNQNYQNQNQNYQNKTKKDTFIGEEVDTSLKKEILDYLFDNVNLYHSRYSIMKTIDHAAQLKNQTYYVSAHFHGYNYLLIIKKFKNQYTNIYFVNKMDLKFNRNEMDDKSAKIYLLKTNMNIDEYNETILDGKLVYKQNEKIFLISDILYLKGNKQMTFKLEDKFNMIDNYLNEINDILEEYFIVKLIKLYKYDELYDLVYNKIKLSDFKINGLVFLPIRTGRIYIYINDTEFDSIKNSPNMEVSKKYDNIKLPSCDDKTEKKLLIQKTQIVDVYEVFTLDKSYRFGIVCVPTIDLSHKLRKYFDNNDQMITNCIFDNKFLKWKPILE